MELSVSATVQGCQLPELDVLDVTVKAQFEMCLKLLGFTPIVFETEPSISILLCGAVHPKSVVSKTNRKIKYFVCFLDEFN